MHDTPPVSGATPFEGLERPDGARDTDGEARREHRQLDGETLALLNGPGAALAVIPMPRIGADPIKEFRAFAWGQNPTTKGPLRLTPDGAAKVMALYRKRGVVLCFDYFHATYDRNARPEDKKAAGQCRLELRADGIWYVDIQWTPKADKEIRDGEWPFISPAVLHDEAGVIVALRNPGLVTDPGLIAVTPTILSGPAPGAGAASQRNNMADKKRMLMDAFAAGQTFMKRCQALADTDGTEKDLGNLLTGNLAATLDKMSSHMQTAGLLDDAMLSAKRMEGEHKAMSALADEFKESDPDKLHAKILAAVDAKAPAAPEIKGVQLSDSDADKVSAALLVRVPVSRREALKSRGLVAIATYLSAVEGMTPSDAPREAAPLPPTQESTKTVTDKLPRPDSGKPKTLADCSPQQRIQVEAHIDSARLFQGADFREEVELQHALATLAADPLPDNTIRHLPYGVDPVTGKVTTLAGSM